MLEPLERMQIGELAERTGVSHRTIHYYERLGLIQPLEREGAGYRYYDGDAVKRLEKIAALKRLGLNLEEVSSVLDLYFVDATGLRGKEEVLKILKAQLAKTDHQMKELTAFKHDLEISIARINHLIAQARQA